MVGRQEHTLRNTTYTYLSKTPRKEKRRKANESASITQMRAQPVAPAMVQYVIPHNCYVIASGGGWGDWLGGGG